MKVLKKRHFEIVYYLYIITIVTLMVIKTDGKIKLAETIWGFRGDHFVHSSIFIPYMIIIGLINSKENNRFLISKKLPFAILFAAFCESLHLLLPYRTFSLFDFFANCIGLMIGMVVWLVVRRIVIRK
jgi:glycopeptide antibiotics resistance protein